MKDRILARGLFLAAIALTFAVTSLNYSTGTFSRAGPGLFPLMVSGLLLLIALLMIVGSRFSSPVPMELKARNIALLLASLCGFAITSKLVNMIAGIVVMVLVSSLAGTSPSLVRSLKVAAGLIAVAFAFQKLLGLNLPLY